VLDFAFSIVLRLIVSGVGFHQLVDIAARVSGIMTYMLRAGLLFGAAGQ